MTEPSTTSRAPPLSTARTWVTRATAADANDRMMIQNLAPPPSDPPTGRRRSPRSRRCPWWVRTGLSILLVLLGLVAPLAWEAWPATAPSDHVAPTVRDGSRRVPPSTTQQRRAGVQRTHHPAVRSAAAAASSGWDLPVPAPDGRPPVFAPFDPPARDWLPGHRGVDLTLTAGAVITAPAAGTVTFAGPVAGRGVVVITHDDGLRSSFEPVSTLVTVGSHVAAGAPVAILEEAGYHCAPAACLHWGVRRGEVYLDPLSLTGGGPPIILLPMP